MAKKPMSQKSNSALPPSPVKEEEEPTPTKALTAALVTEEEEEPTVAGPSSVLEMQEVEATAAAASLEKEKGAHPLFKSVDELRGLSSVLSTFRHHWDELQKHLNFIQNSIEVRVEELNTKYMAAPLQQQPPLEVVVHAPAPDSADAPIPDLPNRELQDLSPSGETVKIYSSRSELQFICETMGGRGLRKYITSHLPDIAKLREEGPAALKRAPNSAKLVLDCIGRFYLQGSKAYGKDSPMIPARQASVLILELFLLAGCSEKDIEPSVKLEAEVAAVAWWKRLINEGGVSKANSMDARGLLLFVGSYGIPSIFGNEDLSELIRLSSPREIADALRRSHFLLERIPDIIGRMVKNGMHIEAVDVACTFGVDEKFPPPTIVTSFLRESKEAWKRTRKETQGSPVLLKEANKKQLASLKSLIKCLEDHKMDPVKLLAGWHINEKITNLEKEIADLNKKIEEKATSKRKADEVVSSKTRTQEVKRPQSTTKVSSQGPVIMLSQEQKTVGLIDGKSLYDGLAGKSFFNGGFSGLFSGYSGVSSMASAAVPAGSDAGMLAGIDGGHVTGAGAAIPTGNVILPTGQFSGNGGALLVGDGVGHRATVGVEPYGWHGDGAFNDNSVGRNFTGHAASSGKGLFGPQPSQEQGFLRLPTTPSLAVMNQSSGSNLYQFADAVLEDESCYSGGSSIGNSVPPAPVHRSSYLH